MARYRKKFKWKNVLSGALCVLLLAGAVMGIASLTGKDTKTIRSTAFSVGAINAEGNYVKSDLSIYTKDMFECQGLSVEPDFEATGTYQVFYYDADKAFLGATEVLNAEDGVYNCGDAYFTAQYARIMITPDVPVDEDGNEVEDFKIRFYEVNGYASDYKITVKKEQKTFKYPFEGENKLVYHESCGVGLSGGANGFAIDPGAADYNVSDMVLTEGCTKICVYGDSSLYSKVRMDMLGETALNGYAYLNDDMKWDVQVVNGITFLTMDIPDNCVGVVLYTLDGNVDFSDFGFYVW